MKNLIQRALTGALYIAVILGGILINDITLGALLSLLAILGIMEFNRLGRNINPSPSSWANLMDIICGVALINAVWWEVFHRVPYGIAAYLLCLLIRTVSALYTPASQPLAQLRHSALGQLWIAFPLALTAAIYSYSPAWVLAMFIFIWINDTGAYLVGSSIGRHRLFESISPKKSWEGFWGGLVFNVAASFAMSCLWPDYFDAPIGFLTAMAAVVTVFSTWGDLMESMVKRTIKVKDSGALLPGHGGILDRIDSLLLVAPAILCMLILFMHR